MAREKRISVGWAEMLASGNAQAETTSMVDQREPVVIHDSYHTP